MEEEQSFSLKLVRSLGVTAAEFMRRSGLSFRTLKRLELGDPGVREDTKAIALRTLAALKAEVQGSAPRRTVAG